MQRIGIGMAAVLVALLAGAAGAETADDGVVGAGWDDRHMMTRYPGGFDAEYPAPHLLGIGESADLLRGEAGPAHLDVPETISSATQRAWQPGRPPVHFGRSGSTFEGATSGAGGLPAAQRSTSRGTSMLRTGVRSQGGR